MRVIFKNTPHSRPRFSTSQPTPKPTEPTEPRHVCCINIYLTSANRQRTRPFCPHRIVIITIIMIHALVTDVSSRLSKNSFRRSDAQQDKHTTRCNNSTHTKPTQFHGLQTDTTDTNTRMDSTIPISKHRVALSSSSDHVMTFVESIKKLYARQSSAAEN